MKNITDQHRIRFKEVQGFLKVSMMMMMTDNNNNK